MVSGPRAGADEDDPEYIMVARVSAFDPPRHLRLDSSRYYARSGALPFAESPHDSDFHLTPPGTRGGIGGRPIDPACNRENGLPGGECAAGRWHWADGGRPSPR